jgi:hypothetical protein
VIALLAPSLLAALVAFETFRAGTRHLALDARAVGLVAAAVCLLAGRRLIVVIAVAAAATALVRAL